MALVLITGCTLSPNQSKQANTWYGITQETKAVAVLTEMSNDVWLTYVEFDLSDGLRGDCNDIALWMGGRAIELGIDPDSFWYALFKYNNEYRYHMAILIEDAWRCPVVVPSSGLWDLDPFVELEEYERITDMELIESFRIEVIE